MQIKYFICILKLEQRSNVCVIAANQIIIMSIILFCLLEKVFSNKKWQKYNTPTFFAEIILKGLSIHGQIPFEQIVI